MRNGLYFSLDALLAVTLLASAFSLVLVTTDVTPQGPSTSYQQADTLAEDNQQLLTRTPLDQALDPDQQADIINDTALTEADLNSSVLEVIAVLWASNQTAEAQDLVERVIGAQIDDRYEYRVRVLNDGSSTIYATAPFNGSSLTARSSRLVSGVARDQPTTGYIAKASLSSVDAIRSEYYYFGGYVGDGTITANMSLPEYREIEGVDMELAVDGNFSLSINGESAGLYNVSDEPFRADTFTVCNATYQTSRCGALEPGDNSFEFSFPGNGSAISGGYLRVQYNETDSLDVQSGRYQTRTRTFTGIEGLVNLFGSMYAPGTLQGISGMLHYDTNATMFLKVGNVTLYSNTTEGEQRVSLSNESIVSDLNESNISLAGLSNRTVPLRLGITNISEIRGQEVDAVSVIDVSGSMLGDRMEEAKNASKEFTDVITNITGNRAGMTAYEEVIRGYHGLTADGGSVKDEIDALTANGNTCIACGILNATESVLEPGYEWAFDRGSGWRWNASYPVDSPPDRDGVNWTEVAYNDSDWSQGSAVLGRGTGAVSTVVPDSGGDYQFRKTFDIDTEEYTGARLYIRSDDAASVYLNGDLVDDDTTEHAGRYWNRVTGRTGLMGTLWEYTDSFESGSLSSNWTLTEGSEGSELLVDDTCGATSGSRATVLTGGGVTLQTDFGTGPDAYLEEIQFSFRQGRDDGPDGNCENPEAGEDVMVEYQRTDGSWQTLHTFRGGDSDPAEGSWGEYTVTAPVDILHPDGQFRFRYPTASGTDSDYWAVDALTAVTAEGERVSAINMSDLRDGNNVVAARLKDDGEERTVGWLTDTTEEWEQGTFQDTTATDGSLELDPVSGAAQEDVDASAYCSVSGGSTAYSEYITDVSLNGIDRSSGNDGGYLDATDSVSDRLVPGESYQLDVTFNTNGYQEYAAVAFDWDGDGSLQDSSATEVGTCDSDGCTVSTDITVPADAATGSTIMRVMGEYDQYHTDACSDPSYNEIEDYSVYVDEDQYETSGDYTSQLLDLGTEVSWSSVDVVSSGTADTSTSIDYSDGDSWYDSISDVPDSSQLRFNVSLLTTDSSVTPSVDSVNISYDAVTAEFDAALELEQVRNRSIVVMSDGVANRLSDMTGVRDHNDNEEGSETDDDDPVDHTIEAACRAWEDHGIRVYAVGFGDGADEETLNETADCGNGEYYFASTGDLTEIFRQISESILEAARTGQQLTFTGDDEGQVGGVLHPDSYLRLNYSSPRGLEFGRVSITQQGDRFGGGVSSPNNGSFEVPEQTELLDARLLSYSSRHWIDFVRMREEGGAWETAYDLTEYGSRFEDLGDPFQVHLPPSGVGNGLVNVSVDTAPNTTYQAGGSPDSRVVYDLQVNGSVGYGDVFEESEGGTTTVQSEHGDFNLSIGNSSAAWNPHEDALDNATARLIDRLDVDGNGEIDFQIGADSLTVDEGTLSGIRWLWGPARLVIEVWRP